jgi:protein-S-isoprenylcysteine O-methyltransferase Ste14
MQLDALRLATSAWILVGIYWVASGIRVKPVARKERSSSRAAHIAIMVAVWVLLFNPGASVGPLATRFVPGENWIHWLGLALTILGCGFAVWGRALLGGNWSATVTLKQGHELVRRGPYALVRHPIYAGLLAGVLGTALIIGEVRALLAFVVAFAGWYDKAAREERFLLDRFDGDYVEYSRSVKRLIPFLL